MATAVSAWKRATIFTLAIDGDPVTVLATANNMIDQLALLGLTVNSPKFKLLLHNLLAFFPSIKIPRPSDWSTLRAPISDEGL